MSLYNAGRTWSPPSQPSTGGSSENVYSTEEVLIGSFFGEPLYRSAFMFNVPNNSRDDFTIGNTIFDIQRIVRYGGKIWTSFDKNIIEFNSYKPDVSYGYSMDYAGYEQTTSGELLFHIYSVGDAPPNSTMLGMWFVEYTKRANETT